MGFNVEFKSPLLPEDFPALQALVGLPVCVDLQVPLLALQSRKGLGTHRTPVRTLSRVSASVNRQVAFGDEALPTLSAGVGSLTAVVPRVQPQLPGGEESLSAFGAQVVLLPSVHADVPRQVLDGRLPANGARVASFPRVCASVYLQDERTPEGLAADGAQEGSLARVNPIVDVQIVSGGVLLLTPVTLKRGSFTVGGKYTLQDVTAKLCIVSERSISIQL